MKLAKRYAQSSVEALVRIIEHQDDYQAEAVEIAKLEIGRRNLDEAELLKVARQVVKEKIETYLEAFSVVNDQLALPTSYFLNEEEVKLLFRVCFNKWKEENDDMIPDSWLYVLGAGFG